MVLCIVIDRIFDLDFDLIVCMKGIRYRTGLLHTTYDTTQYSVRDSFWIVLVFGFGFRFRFWFYCTRRNEHKLSYKNYNEFWCCGLRVCVCVFGLEWWCSRGSLCVCSLSKSLLTKTEISVNGFRRGVARQVWCINFEWVEVSNIMSSNLIMCVSIDRL